MGDLLNGAVVRTLRHLAAAVGARVQPGQLEWCNMSVLTQPIPTYFA